MRQRASENCGGAPDPANWGSGRRVHRRRKPETLSFPPALRGSSSTVVPGLSPAEPESCLSQERVCQSLMQVIIGGKCSNPSNFECGIRQRASGQALLDWLALHTPC